ncbi:MAG: adenine nucleotide alpha hydrolase [Kiritimatiellae bacterium]|nr:adenine nucleotide alpha hydrolase [Kiritimatiellia bacterium]
MTRKQVLLSWSSGKDSAWALHLLRRDPAVEVVGLFSVLNARFNRVSMHATRADLLRRQAQAAGLPLETIKLPDPCTMEQCDAVMGEFVAGCAAKGIERMAFGDLFLEDVRGYREKQMAGTGIEPLFPLWGMPSAELAEGMLAAGLVAYLSSVDLKKLPVSFAGRRWSHELLRELPAGVDPCGENGELHTVVAAGPMFAAPIAVEVGEIVERNGFAYADIVPVPQ